MSLFTHLCRKYGTGSAAFSEVAQKCPSENGLIETVWVLAWSKWSSPTPRSKFPILPCSAPISVNSTSYGKTITYLDWILLTNNVFCFWMLLSRLVSASKWNLWISYYGTVTKTKSDTDSHWSPIYFPWNWWDQITWSGFSEYWSFKPTTLTFHFHQRTNSSSFSAIEVVVIISEVVWSYFPTNLDSKIQVT